MMVVDAVYARNTPGPWHVVRSSYPGYAEILCASGRVKVDEFATESTAREVPVCGPCKAIHSGLLDRMVRDVRMAEVDLMRDMEDWLQAHERSWDETALGHLDMAKDSFEKLMALRGRYGLGRYSDERKKLGWKETVDE